MAPALSASRSAPPRLQAAPAPEAHRLRPPVPPRRRRHLPRARRNHDTPDPLGTHRPAIRPARQVRHRPTARHRRIRADAAPLYPRRPQAPHLPSPRRTRTHRPHRVYLRLPRRPRPATRDQRRPTGRRALEQRQHRHLLGQGQRAHRRRPRRPRNLDARPAPPAIRARTPQHPARTTRPRRPRLGPPPDRRRPPRPHPAVLVKHQPLRHLPPRHDHTHRPRTHRRDHQHALADASGYFAPTDTNPSTGP